jgi:hypothetical protein
MRAALRGGRRRRPGKKSGGRLIFTRAAELGKAFRPAGDTISRFVLGVADVAAGCPRQLAVQSASAVRQPFECTANGMSLLSGGSWLMLHAIAKVSPSGSPWHPLLGRSPLAVIRARER